ncbi:hypothetical protein M501DRAFT_939696 [Patellaria atrata CBS 101060]|uniref:Vacuolar ATPase assembly integral membrane protein VMA21 n=1 Tax=Patellaria atrata CBS 101060 TaxID=1346257 RepID=A0A9P4S7D7_9PEZI|nr:hypothetical protein M501DRAFT_939696 [Patellaria atrata CBS 101060]
MARPVFTDAKISSSVKEDHAAPPSRSSEKSNITPAVPAPVIFKLLAFTFAMITLPIGSFFFTRDYVFRGNTTFAGGFAAIMANMVLIGYVIVAMKEDQSDRMAEEKQRKSK